MSKERSFFLIHSIGKKKKRNIVLKIVSVWRNICIIFLLLGAKLHNQFSTHFLFPVRESTSIVQLQFILSPKRQNKSFNHAFILVVGSISAIITNKPDQSDKTIPDDFVTKRGKMFSFPDCEEKVGNQINYINYRCIRE